MTRKEELIAFIQMNVNETNQLKVAERMLIPASEMLKANQLGSKRFVATPEHIIDVILDGFNDNLEGHYHTDQNKVKIIDWYVEPIST